VSPNECNKSSRSSLSACRRSLSARQCHSNAKAAAVMSGQGASRNRAGAVHTGWAEKAVHWLQ
jgi:hypothetical protein